MHEHLPHASATRTRRHPHRDQGRGAIVRRDSSSSAHDLAVSFRHELVPVGKPVAPVFLVSAHLTLVFRAEGPGSVLQSSETNGPEDLPIVGREPAKLNFRGRTP